MWIECLFPQRHFGHLRDGHGLGRILWTKPQLPVVFPPLMPGPVRRPLRGLPSPCWGKESDTEAKITGSDLFEGPISTKSTVPVLIASPDVDPHVDIMDCFARYI